MITQYMVNFDDLSVIDTFEKHRKQSNTRVEAEKLSGLLVEKQARCPKLEIGSNWGGEVAEVLGVGGSRVSRICLELKRSSSKKI